MPAYPNVVLEVGDSPAGARVPELAGAQAAETGGWHELVSRRHGREPSADQRTLLVGVHDSEHSMRAAGKAGAVAADLDAELILAGAYERTKQPRWHTRTATARRANPARRPTGADHHEHGADQPAAGVAGRG